MITIYKVKQGTQEWHDLRSNLITASNAHVLLARGIYAAMNTGKGNHGGYWAERGHILEEEAIEIYEAVKGVRVERPGFITNSDYPNAGYSPDADYGRLIEVKCFKTEKHLQCLKEVPSKVYAQVQFGMMIAERNECDVVFYNPDIEDNALCFKITTVKRDARIIARFTKKLSEAQCE